MTTAFHLVIPDTSGLHVLLVEEESGWALPRVTSTERWGVVRAIPRSVRERFGLEVVVLRSILVAQEDGSDEGSDDEFRFTENVGEVPGHLSGWTTEGALTERVMVDERDRDAALRWFTERRNGGPERLEPWQRDGWFAEAASWARSSLPDVLTVEQYASWNGSALLRIETGNGCCYLKAAPDYFRSEGAVTALLAGHFPSAVPRPVALDSERGWMVLRDFGETLVGETGLDHWEGALDTMVSIQRASVPIIEDLIRDGCRDRRPAVLLTQIEAFAEGGLGPIPDGYATRLRDAVPRFDELHAELEEAPIPDTLVHGDFHPANIAIEDSRYVIFDWTDACVAHPFVDLQTFFHTFGPPTTDAAVRERLLHRYLTGWEGVMPRNEAAFLYRRTEPLTAMHHAITYQAILERLDPTERWQWESHLPWWIDKALEGFT